MALKISRILHAGYVFKTEQTQIAFDPIFENPFSKNCFAFPDVKFDLEKIKDLKLSAVFISHYHDDHCSLESLQHLDKDTPVYIYCVFEELFLLVQELGFKNVHSLQLDTPVLIGDFEITPRRALDADVDSMFQIKSQGLNILNVVDSWIDDDVLNQLQTLSPWDLILWPFQTMREIEVLTPSRNRSKKSEIPSEWISQLQKLNSRYLIPSSCQFLQESWSWYNQAFFPISYEQFQQEMKVVLPSSTVMRLNPSASLILDKDSAKYSEKLNWVIPVGDQNVDYKFDSEIIAPLTADIAKNFEALTKEQTEKIYSYCQKDLIEKFSSLEHSLDPYFEKSRFWRLSVFDHTGACRNFFYQIQKNKIYLTDENPAELSWTTEIPISRFYGALEFGETLTSLYLRINDVIFSDKIEQEIESVDVIEDPLIRCLFNGSFGSYQKAQLIKIKKTTLEIG